MQWSRVKSILIVILLLVDGFLAVNIAGKYVSRYYRATETAHNMTVLLAQRGISQGDSFMLPEAQKLPALQLDISRADEDAFSYGLLGEGLVREDKPDGTVSYVSAHGTLLWSSSGRVTGALVPEEYVCPEDARSLTERAQELLRMAGVINAVDLQCDAQAGTVRASFQTAGVPVFNRGLTFGFEPDRVTLSGWWTFGVPYTTRSGSYIAYPAVDAVFLLAGQQAIGRIDHMETGFYLTETGSGRVQMSPGWWIETDQGAFFVDSLKKTAVAVEKN